MKLAASDEEFCTPEKDWVCSAYPNLCEPAREGRPMPELSADHCICQSTRLFISWSHVAPCEFGMKALLASTGFLFFIANIGGAAHESVAGWSLSLFSTCMQIYFVYQLRSCLLSGSLNTPVKNFCVLVGVENVAVAVSSLMSPKRRKRQLCCGSWWTAAGMPAWSSEPCRMGSHVGRGTASL